MKMRAAVISKPQAPIQLVERDIPTPGRGEVRIKVQACGLCHSDALVKEGHWPGLAYPRVPGHELAGIIDAVGPDVPNWRVGQRAGVGWYGGHCGYCEPCRRGRFIVCQNAKITGLHFDGGYADYMIAPAQAAARIPDDISPLDAGPLMCAGITTFNALRNSGARAGDLVAVLGIGGLGHLGVQFAARMGFRTIAIARGKDKAPLARELGAHVYIDSQAEKVPEALQKLGGATIILATATHAGAISEAVGGLAVDGKLVVLGAPGEPLSISALALIGGRRGVQGWPSGTSIDSEDTLSFSSQAGVKPMIETFPLERAAEAYDRMISGNARFRVVMTTGH